MKTPPTLILGTMTFGESVFSPDVHIFIEEFLKFGYNIIDTAYVYNDGVCEKLLGEALHDINQNYKIATKVNPRVTGKLDAQAAYLQVNESLQRLNLASVDIVFLHFPDPQTPVEYVLDAMNELQKQGKFRELGLSNFPAWMVADICHLCEKKGWIKPTIYEGIYNPLTRKAEIELNDCLKHFGLRFYAYNPMAGGLLTGKYESFDDIPTEGRFKNRPNYQNRYWKETYFNAIEMIKNKVKKYNISCVEATYRWLSYHSMLDGNRGDGIIIGASKINHLIENMKAVEQGPLPYEIVDAFERAWEACKSDSPEYFTLYKGNK